jgi:hypothetical protein
MNTDDKLKVLTEAAMWLCCEVSVHSIECTCGSCAAASKAVPYLPELSGHYKEQFERRWAVAQFVANHKTKGPQ